MSLSPTERRVVVFLMSDWSLKDIGMNYDTARSMIHRACVKTGMSGKRELKSFVLGRPVLYRLLMGEEP